MHSINGKKYINQTDLDTLQDQGWTTKPLSNNKTVTINDITYNVTQKRERSTPLTFTRGIALVVAAIGTLVLCGLPLLSKSVRKWFIGREVVRIYASSSPIDYKNSNVTPKYTNIPTKATPVDKLAPQVVNSKKQLPPPFPKNLSPKQKNLNLEITPNLKDPSNTPPVGVEDPVMGDVNQQVSIELESNLEAILKVNDLAPQPVNLKKQSPSPFPISLSQKEENPNLGITPNPLPLIDVPLKSPPVVVEDPVMRDVNQQVSVQMQSSQSTKIDLKKNDPTSILNSNQDPGCNSISQKNEFNLSKDWVLNKIKKAIPEITTWELEENQIMALGLLYCSMNHKEHPAFISELLHPNSLDYKPWYCKDEIMEQNQKEIYYDTYDSIKIIKDLQNYLPLIEIEYSAEKMLETFNRYGVIQLREIKDTTLVLGCGNTPASKKYYRYSGESHDHKETTTLNIDLSMNPTVLAFYGYQPNNRFFQDRKEKFQLIIDEGPISSFLADQKCSNAFFEAVRSSLQPSGYLALPAHVLKDFAIPSDFISVNHPCLPEAQKQCVHKVVLYQFVPL